MFICMRRFTILIGIDGCGGSGKSTLATELMDRLKGIRETSIVHMDDFYLPSKERDNIRNQDGIGVNFDWKRLQNQILLPMSNGAAGYYQRYDWNSDSLLEWCTVPPGIVIIEGVYTLRQELFNFYHFTIWAETPHETRLLRGIERDGEEMRNTWEQDWMPAEQHYVETEQPHRRADLIIDGADNHKRWLPTFITQIINCMKD
ncbi:Uridine kinase [Paenibacillaceae bacterium GAS479]|nr:Uridine kinase [Paenibacillaceae bacterium GAS479]